MLEFLNKYFFYFNKDNIKKFLNMAIISNILIYCHTLLCYYNLFFTNINKDDFFQENYDLLALPMFKLILLVYDLYLIKEFLPLIIKKYKAKELNYKPIEVYFFSTILCWMLIIFNLIFLIDWLKISMAGYIKVFFYSIFMLSVGLYFYRKVDKLWLKKE